MRGAVQAEARTWDGQQPASTGLLLLESVRKSVRQSVALLLGSVSGVGCGVECRGWSGLVSGLVLGLVSGVNVVSMSGYLQISL